ncbi:MAG TPA: fluoride efflux transporter CrcB [Candidatus Polarisedimenticolia bacterium]|jgi:CrcB protein
MLKLSALAVAGALATLARYWLTGFVHRYTRETFPTGTLVVNVLGCFLIGLVMYLVREQQAFGPETRVVIVVGLLGGFTTFSAFGYETIELLRGGDLPLAGLNILGNVLVGVLAVWLGAAAGRVLGL